MAVTGRTEEKKKKTKEARSGRVNLLLLHLCDQMLLKHLEDKPLRFCTKINTDSLDTVRKLRRTDLKLV